MPFPAQSCRLLSASLVIALGIAGRSDEAIAAADGLIYAAEATHNPMAIAYALHACGGSPIAQCG